MRLFHRLMMLSVLLLSTMLVVPAYADAPPQFTLKIHNHRFEPGQLTIPAGTKVRILVRNLDATPEEFESTDFNREKLVMPHGTITVYVGPLHAGSYRFFGDFHQATAQGRLIVE